MSFWYQIENRMQKGTEATPDIDEEVLFWGYFILESGKLDGKHLVDYASHNADGAMEMLSQYVEELPEEEKPNDGNEILGMVEWQNDDERESFLRLVSKEE